MADLEIRVAHPCHFPFEVSKIAAGNYAMTMFGG
jgi:hypothetical protein